MTAYRALLDSGKDVTRVALAGESAGANLAVVTLAAVQRAGLPQPASAVLMSPLADLGAAGQSITAKADVDPVITAGSSSRAFSSEHAARSSARADKSKYPMDRYRMA